MKLSYKTFLPIFGLISRGSRVQLSYWRQFEQGMLSQDAVRILMELCEIAADNKGR